MSRHLPSPSFRFFFASLILILNAFSTSAQSPYPSKPSEDPVIGRWKWSNGQVVILETDGTAHCDVASGKWKVLSTATPRKYEINWSNSRSIDTVHLVKNGKELEGSTKGSGKISAERLPAETK